MSFRSALLVGFSLLIATASFAGEATLSQGTLSRPVIEVWKAKRKMVLRDGDHIVRRFDVSLGIEAVGPKQRRGDLKTPVGKYFISDKNGGSRFHRFLGLSYPNIDDAERGYNSHLVDEGEWADVFLSNVKRDRPPHQTALGGRVGIHGHGGRPVLGVDWTEGCIAISDDEIEYLFRVVGIGTPVIIHE